MHNTKGDVTLMNINRETNYFHFLVQLKKSSSPFLSLSMFLECSFKNLKFKNFGHFPASRSYKKNSHKKECTSFVYRE